MIGNSDVPAMNGFDLTLKVKTELPDIKAIIMTGRHKSECLEMMAARWVDGWLFKPFGLSELRYKLRDLGLPEH